MKLPTTSEINALVQANLRKDLNISTPSAENVQEFADRISHFDVSRINTIVESVSGVSLSGSSRKQLNEDQSKASALPKAASWVVSQLKSLMPDLSFEVENKYGDQSLILAKAGKTPVGDIRLKTDKSRFILSYGHGVFASYDNPRAMEKVSDELNKMTVEQLMAVKEDASTVQESSLKSQYNEMVKAQELMKKDGKEETEEYKKLLSSMAEINAKRMAEKTESKALRVGSKVVLSSGEVATVLALGEGVADLKTAEGVFIESASLGLLKPHGDKKTVGQSDASERKKDKSSLSEDDKSASKLSELMAKAHKTLKAGTFYFSDWRDAPKDVVKALQDAEVEVEESDYTVGEPSAFLRASMTFADGGEADFEVSLGSLREFADEWDEQNPDGDEDDKEEHLEGVAKELASSFGTSESGDSVYFHVTENPGVDESVCDKGMQEDDERDTPEDEKKFILGQIKSARKLAVQERKAGNIQKAQKWEAAIERYIDDAKEAGFGEEAEDFDQEMMEKYGLGESKAVIKEEMLTDVVAYFFDGNLYTWEGLKAKAKKINKTAKDLLRSGDASRYTVQDAMDSEGPVSAEDEDGNSEIVWEESKTQTDEAKKSKGSSNGKKVDYGFDLTTFENAANFLTTLELSGLSTTPKKNSDGYFVWSGDGLEMVTANNPLTGENDDSRRGKEEGYASYMGITGEPEKVKKLVSQIKKVAVYKDESPGSRDFI